MLGPLGLGPLGLGPLGLGPLGLGSEFCSYIEQHGKVREMNLSFVLFSHWTEMLNLVRKLFLMISCLDMIFFHTTGLLRHQGFQENWKKANKGRKGQIKGQRVQIAKNIDFLVFLWLFGVKDAMVFLFWIFKAIKTKKAAIVAKNANFHYGKFIEPKLLLWHSEE